MQWHKTVQYSKVAKVKKVQWEKGKLKWCRWAVVQGDEAPNKEYTQYTQYTIQHEIYEHNMIARPEINGPEQELATWLDMQQRQQENIKRVCSQYQSQVNLQHRPSQLINFPSSNLLTCFINKVDNVT